MRPHEHLLCALRKGQTIQRARKGLFFDMWVMQQTIAQPIARRIQNLPSINIVVPAGVRVQDRDRNIPGCSNLFQLHAKNIGVIRCGGAGDKAEDKAQTSHPASLAHSCAKNTQVSVCWSGPSGRSSTARDCDANSRRKSMRQVMIVAPISAAGPKSHAAAESAK